MIAEEANQEQTENKNQYKEFRMATKMKIRRMSDVQLQEVAWLFKPYIPFEKLTIIQGDPGEGKTTLALRVSATCSTGTALPGIEACAPFDVIYQTVEDGLGDTVKPRLIEAGADESRILNIVEDNKSLSLLDERIEKAMVLTGAKLMMLDPMQGYLGDKIDMNRANEIRIVLKNVAAVAERTGCPIVLVGHLNKASGYEQEQTALKEKLISVNDGISRMDMRDSCIREFIAKAKQYIKMPTLTPELLQIFIRKIEVFEKLEKYSRTAGNLIIIHYAFQLPEQDGMPVLEMLLPSNMREPA